MSDPLLSNTEWDAPDISYKSFKKERSQRGASLRRSTEYYVFRLGLFLGKALPLTTLQTLGKGLGKLAYAILKKDRGIIETQLGWIFPEVPEPQRDQWTRACFMNFGQMLFEFFALPQLSKNFEQCVQVEEEDVLDHAIAQQKGVILVTLHMGNWELISPYFNHRKIALKAATTNVPGARLNDLILENRSYEHVEIVNRGDPHASKKMLKCFKNKEVFVLAIDQDTNVPSQWSPFFGIPAKTPVSAASLALKTGAEVVGFVSLRQKDGSFKLRFFPIHTGTVKKRPKAQDIFDLTQVINQHTEELIVQNPEQWAWFHRRWRHRPSEEELSVMELLQEGKAIKLEF